MKNKIIIILGPTAIGKSDLAVLLALKYGGEIISADSRQVYKGLNIGTGKITKKEMLGVPHHLLDIISPKKVYSVADWQKAAQKKIKEIFSRKKIPIICGGTGFYIDSITKGFVLPEVAPNKELRKKLSKKSTEELLKILQKLDPDRVKTIEQKNPVRLVRAIEIASALGKVPTLVEKEIDYDILKIGLILPFEKIDERISLRLKKRLKNGMLAEAKKLHKSGLSWKRMNALGLEYRYEALFLQGKISKDKFIDELSKEIRHYSRRQMTWFRKDKKTKWFSPFETKKIEKQVGEFLEN